MRKNIKKLLGCSIMAAAFGMVMPSAFSAQITARVEKNQITVSGDEFIPGELIDTVVYKPGKNTSNTDSDTVSENVVFVWEALPDEKGEFSYKFNINDAEENEGLYTISSDGKAENKTFYFLASAGLADVLSEFNAIESDYEEFLTKYTDASTPVLDISVNDEYRSNKQDINALMLKEKNRISGAKSTADIEKIYNNACVVHRFNYTSDLGGFFVQNYKIIGIDPDDFFVANKDKIATLSKNLLNKNYKESKVTYVNDIVTIYKTAYLLCRLNTNNQISVADKIISENAELFGISKTKYDSYTSPTVGSILIGKTFNTDEDVKNAAESAMIMLDQKKNQGGSGSGSGGSSGSGSVFVPVTQVPTISEDSVFDDIDTVSWAREAIKYLNKRGVVNGKGDRVFAPNENILREEFITMVVKLMNLENGDNIAVFNDVPSDAWFAPYVNAAAKEEIIYGKATGAFGSGENITRQEMAAILYRCIQKKGITLPVIRGYSNFEDQESISEYAKEAVQKMYEAEIISGMENGDFAPEDFSTRAQAAKMIYGIILIIG